MQIQREDANGDLYQMSLYSAGVLWGSSPRQRAGRRRLTDAAKREINRQQRKWRLMQLLNANFRGGRDLFVCLTYREVPESEGRALKNFHARMRRAYARLGIEYRYILVTETHDMDGEPVRLHHHVILSGAHGHRLAEVVRGAWTCGTADVRTLREGADMFEDTAQYLLKSDAHQPKGARRYETSRNLRPPAEPVRLRLPESECGEVPPGVTILEHEVKANEFGRYETMVGRIYDHTAFDAYWARQRRRAAPDPWERLARRHRRKRE